MQHYAKIITDRKEQVIQISKYVVADTYFSKKPFVSAMNNNGFDVGSSLRTDAYLQYLLKGKQKGGRGRPREFAGKIDYKNVDMSYFNLVYKSEKSKALHAKVKSKSLQRIINLAIVFTKSKGKWTHKLYLSGC